MKKKNFVFILFLLPLLMQPVSSNIVYSNNLHKGDVFIWEVETNYEDGDFLENNTQVTLEVISNPGDVQINDFADTAELFELKMGNTTYNYEWDDIFFFFVVPTEFEDEDGNTLNLAEDFIYAVYDDLYFNDIPIYSETNGNILHQDANYTIGDSITLVITEVDVTTGVMQSVYIESYTYNNYDESQYIWVNQTDRILVEGTETVNAPIFDIITYSSLIIAAITLSFKIKRNRLS